MPKAEQKDISFIGGRRNAISWITGSFLPQSPCTVEVLVSYDSLTPHNSLL